MKYEYLIMCLVVVIILLVPFQWIPVTFAENVCQETTTPKCFNATEMGVACAIAELFPNSKLVFDTLTLLSLSLSSLTFSGDLLHLFNDIAGKFGTVAPFFIKCDSDAVSSKTEIAKHLLFTIFDSNGCNKTLNGTELYNNNCRANLFSNISDTAPIIFLMAGYKSNCEKYIGSLSDDTTWIDRTAPFIAMRLKGTAIHINWGVEGLACCNFFQILCAQKSLSELLADVFLKCFPKPSQFRCIGFSEGCPLLAEAIKIVKDLTGEKAARFDCLDPPGPGYTTSCSSVGKCSYILGSNAMCTQIWHGNPGVFGESQIYTPCDGPCNYVSDIQLVNTDGIHCYPECKIFTNNTCGDGCMHKMTTTVFAKYVCLDKIEANVTADSSLYLSFYNCTPYGSYNVESSTYNRSSINICDQSKVCKP